MKQSRWCRICVQSTFFFLHAALAAQTNIAPLTAHEWPKLLRRAQQGNAKAQIRVALAFSSGETVKQDFVEARR